MLNLATLRSTIAELISEVEQYQGADISSLVEAGEFSVAMEIYLDNLFEYETPITQRAYDLALFVSDALELDKSKFVVPLKSQILPLNLEE